MPLMIATVYEASYTHKNKCDRTRLLPYNVIAARLRHVAVYARAASLGVFYSLVIL